MVFCEKLKKFFLIMSLSLREALLKYTSSRRTIARIVHEATSDPDAYDAKMTQRQIGKIIDSEFPKKREREVEEEEEEYIDTGESGTLLENCVALEALTRMYSYTRSHEPYGRILYEKMRRIAERIEPTEEHVEPNLDTIVSVSDRIRHFFPNHNVDLKTLYDIGRKAKEYHIEVYQCAPRKMERDDGTWVNVYTEETAPETLDRAIQDVLG